MLVVTDNEEKCTTLVREVSVTEIAPPSWDALQEVNVREVSVREASEPSEAAIAPPLPEEAEQELKVMKERVREVEVREESSNAAPFPLFRRMFVKEVLEKERWEVEEEEMIGDWDRVMFSNDESTHLNVPY